MPDSVSTEATNLRSTTSCSPNLIWAAFCRVTPRHDCLLHLPPNGGTVSAGAALQPLPETHPPTSAGFKTEAGPGHTLCLASLVRASRRLAFGPVAPARWSSRVIAMCGSGVALVGDAVSGGCPAPSGRSRSLASRLGWPGSAATMRAAASAPQGRNIEADHAEQRWQRGGGPAGTASCTGWQPAGSAGAKQWTARPHRCSRRRRAWAVFLACCHFSP